jgi:N-acetylglucosaminyl-diphospho-decaprenol L-rhamnosyltransferase
MNQSCTIIIVSYNCRDALSECLRMLTAQGDAPPIIVVDNASTDGSADMAAHDFPSIHLIRNTRNCGFAAACNQGIGASNTDFILLLNPDTLLECTELQKLHNAMNSRPNVGACGPRILNVDGSLQPSCRTFPTFWAMVCDEIGLGRLLPHSRLFATYRMSGWAHNETREVDQLMGSCLLLRRAALEAVGPLDERFFLYFEEVDLCWRLWQAGWRVLFVANATVTHVGGVSSRADRPTALHHRYRSLFTFYRKHYPRWQLPILKGAVQIAILARVVLKQSAYWPIARDVWKL